MLMNRTIACCLLLKMILTIVLDVTFLSELHFSLQLGVEGVAYTNIITEAANNPKHNCARHARGQLACTINSAP